MYTYEEYHKQNTLGSTMTGVLLGQLKYGDLNHEQKRELVKQLKWCYNYAGIEIPESVQKDLDSLSKF